MTLSFDYSNVKSFMNQSEVDNLSEFVKVAHDMLHDQKGPGSDYLGWVTLPYDYDKEEFSRIKAAAAKNSEVLLMH